MSKVSAKIFFITFLTASFIISCGQPESNWEGTIEEVDGVLVVKNPKEPIYGEDVLTLDEDLVLGEEEFEGEPLFFSIPSIREGPIAQWARAIGL